MSKRSRRAPSSKKVAAVLRQLAPLEEKPVAAQPPETEALALEIGRMIETVRSHVA